jgi:hypothetical protein
MPFFVPLANQHTSMDPSFIPLLRATLTKLLNNVGVGDMVFICSLYDSCSTLRGKVVL